VTSTVTSPVGVARRVDTALVEFLDERARALSPAGPDLDPIVCAARSCVLAGGKRLRPVFAYLAWRAAAGPGADDEAMLAAAASLELLHACALVHDDVMDGSELRRGQPSAHMSFGQLHAERSFSGDGAAFGRAAAIVLGDLLLCWSDRMLYAAPFDARTARGVRRVYDDMREQVITGQYLDLLVQARGGYSTEDALRVAEYKTSKYTVEGPLLMGAAAGNGSTALTAALRAYARPLGEAFQLRDDVLGVFGDPRRTGKPAGDDLREGKRTLLVAIAMQRADPVQAAVLRRHLGDSGLDDAGRAALRYVIVDTGALTEVEARILANTAQARAALVVPAVPPDVGIALDHMAVAATRRQM
jgi:geranylgeranyl diphosphate synthase, type I